MSPGLRVAEAGAESAAQWDDFVARAPSASVYHRWLWRDLVEREFACETHYLMCREPSGGVAGVLPLVRLRSLLFGDFIVSLPYFNYGGPLSLSAAADNALLESAVGLAQRLGVSHIELRELAARDGRWPVRTDKACMILALEPTVDEQWSKLGSKLRSQVRRPEREGATVRFGGAELVDDFYRVFSRNMRDLGTPVYAKSLFRRILDDPAAGAEVAIVQVKGEPAAAGFLLHHGESTEIPWASSLREWNRIGVNMYLYWEILRRAIERGSREFDFGRSTVDAGTYRFKAQWGARPRPLYWHYWLPDGQQLPRLDPNNPKYEMAIRLWRKLPVFAANLIGPRLVRNLP